MGFQAAIPQQQHISQYICEWKERVVDCLLFDGGLVLYRALKGKTMSENSY